MVGIIFQIKLSRWLYTDAVSPRPRSVLLRVRAKAHGPLQNVVTCGQSEKPRHEEDSFRNFNRNPILPKHRNSIQFGFLFNYF